jgi:hypothetical protein
VFLDDDPHIGYVVSLDKVKDAQALIAELTDRRLKQQQKRRADFAAEFAAVKKAEGSELG